MKFETLAQYFALLEATPSRLEKIRLLSELMIEGKESITQIIYLSQGRVVPFFINLEFNIGNSLIQKAIAHAGNTKPEVIISMYNEIGDLGDVIYTIFDTSGNHTGEDKKLTVDEVHNKLTSLVHTHGKDSTSKKIEILSLLLSSSDKESARYILRIILGKLRLGFSDKTMLDAMAVAFTKDKKNRIVIEHAYYRCSDLGYIAKKLATEGIIGVEAMSLIPSVPVFPKLVERASSVEEIFKRMPEPLFQPKYDGLRVQIHLFKNELGDRVVRMFSRRLEELTEMFPDICQEVLSMHLDSAIFDSETIGFNPDTQEFVTFQETIQRKRKYDVAGFADKIPVTSFVFDLLYLNGEDITKKTLDERLEILRGVLDANKHQTTLQMSESLVMHSSEEGQVYFMACVDKGLEGIIAKDTQTSYSPGTRNFEWIKLKKASVSDLNDTIDCVVLGYYFGYGQRSKFGIGALLVGVYNKKEDQFETIAKIGTGMKDEDLTELKKILDVEKIPVLPTNVIVDKSLTPDIIVEPKIIVEIRSDEITRSSIHSAGRNEGGLGYALRFPRLITIRADKAPNDITSIEQLLHIIKRKA